MNVQSTAKRTQVTPNYTQFPTMGESLIKSLMNASGKSSKYTKTVAKNTQGRGSSPTGKSAVRNRTMIHEANGPACHIVTSLYKPNAAEASSTQRNTKILPPTIERPDHVGSAATFWQKRIFGQKLQ